MLGVRKPSRFALQLLGSFVAFAVVPASVLAVIAYLEISKADREACFEHLRTAAESRADSIRACFDQHRLHAALLARHPPGARGKDLGAPEGDPARYRFTDASGAGCSGLDAAGVARLRAGGQVFAGERVLVGAPIEEGGAAVVEIPLATIEALVNVREGLGRTGRTFLVTAGRRTVGQSGVAPPAPGRSDYFDGSGVHWLRAVAKAGEATVVAEVQASEAFGPVRALSGRLLALGAIFFLLVMGALCIATIRTERAIDSLVAGIESAGRGEFGARTEVGAQGASWVARIRRALNETHGKLAERDAEIHRQRQELFCQRCELERLNAEIVQADRMKSQFIANMSHEVRTPLHSVLSLSEMLLRGVSGPLGDEQRKQVGIIERNGRRLHEMLGDILDFSKIEAGRMSVSPEPVSPASVLAGVREAVLPLGESKRVDVVLDAPPDLGWIESDPEKLHRILLNLAHNAVKFTLEGSVTLRARARPQGGVDFQVIDTGPGIPASQIGLLFQPFRQLDGSTTRAAGGTGLGLSIAKSLAELLGGRISVESTEGRGSTFTVALPARGPVRAPGGPRPTTSARDLLIVGASPASGEALHAEIEAAGFAAGRAVCGRDVRNALDRTGVGAVLLDAGVFLGEGLDVLLAVGARLEADRTPILAYWLRPDAGRGGILGRARVASDGGGGFTIEFENAPVLRIPPRIDAEARAAAHHWCEGVQRGDAHPLHETVRALLARLDALLARDAGERGHPRGTVLVVDPDADSRYATALQLERAGFQVRAVGALGEAPRDFRPGAVVMENSESPASARDRFGAPVVVLTADARAEAQEAALREGATAFLTKPVASTSLMDRLSRLEPGSRA